MSERITTRISTGELAGVREDGIDRWLGIPYAAAPVGPRRFAEPAPHEPWDGTRDAIELGPTSPQTPIGPALAHIIANRIIPGDEFLNVNVWAPAGASGRPVMVWVHGGSLVHGSNALDGYDGSAFARDGVVLVSVNYRLGQEGFSVLDDAPTNLGIADVAAALRWVRAEIAAFGGDPASVTVFGESAGGVLVSTLLASPAASGLFDRAIVQSGMFTSAPRAKAGRVTRALATVLGVPATRAAFAAVPMERMLDADEQVRSGGTPLDAKPGYTPAIGDELVPRATRDAARDGAGDGIPVLAGWTAEEHRLWFRPGSKPVSPVLVALLRLRFGVGPKRLAAYRAAGRADTPTELAGHLLIDHAARLPFLDVADRRRSRGAAPTWFYEFAWRSPAHELGAAHAMEIGFVFDRLASPDWIAMTGPDAPQPLATAMHDAWVRFATTGDPGWRAWDERHPVMVFDAASAEVDGPHDAELGRVPRAR
jgi:para-nitrobenzyl esterase